MQCQVYKSLKLAEAYLFVAGEVGDLSPVPEKLRERIDPLQHVMSLDLHPGRKLARADPEVVHAALLELGYYLQMPPPKTPLMRNDRL